MRLEQDAEARRNAAGEREAKAARVEQKVSVACASPVSVTQPALCGAGLCPASSWRWVRTVSAPVPACSLTHKAHSRRLSACRPRLL